METGAFIQAFPFPTRYQQRPGSFYSNMRKDGVAV
jgi:hypothetical protein